MSVSVDLQIVHGDDASGGWHSRPPGPRAAPRRQRRSRWLSHRASNLRNVLRPCPPTRGDDGARDEYPDLGVAAHTAQHPSAADDSWWQALDDSCGQHNVTVTRDSARAPDGRTTHGLAGSDPRANCTQLAATKSHRACDDTCWQDDDPCWQSEQCASADAHCPLNTRRTQVDSRLLA